ncbi:MAG: hypothetical protein HQ592_00810, partial [Planctomycetes bacterium]|nr:hypothetical protein [Planctomycetota bacterium]
MRRVTLTVGLLCCVAACTFGADNDKRADELFETAQSAFNLKRYEDAATKFYDFMAAAPYDPRNDQAQYY